MEWNLEEALTYYQSLGAPSDQSALIGLLREIQDRKGCIHQSDLQSAAQFYQIKEGLLLALIRRIPSLRLEQGHLLELCAGPNCGRHTAIAACAEKLQSQGKCTLKYVPCMRLCGKGPNIRWDGTLYHGADEALLRKLTENN
jgi:NADH:ubiquinone oxidoreductase subunit E